MMHIIVFNQAFCLPLVYRVSTRVRETMDAKATTNLGGKASTSGDMHLMRKHLQKQGVLADDVCPPVSHAGELPTESQAMLAPDAASMLLRKGDEVMPVCSFQPSSALDKYMLRAHPVPALCLQIKNPWVSTFSS